jgi:segregation and condensation protein A
MAAWLAYLKSCLLLPKDPEAGPEPEELALRLQLRLQRLDAMREAGARLMAATGSAATSSCAARPRACGWCASPPGRPRFDLFAAYGAIRARTSPPMHVVHARPVMTLEEALERVGG